MSVEKYYDADTVMKNGYPRIRKRGAIGPAGGSSPFVFEERLYRLELEDSSHGLDRGAPSFAVIRDAESGKILSRFGYGCYYYSFYEEDGTVYVIGTKSIPPSFSGDTLILYQSRDLVNWSCRELLSNRGWEYLNTSLTKGPDGYMLCLQAEAPKKYVGENYFSMFFARSEDLVSWEMLDYDKGYPKDRYAGAPRMKYSGGWYYLICVTELPCKRYTDYIFRTSDFENWEAGYYNPLLMPDEDDRKISVDAHDLSPSLIEKMKTGFISGNSNIDMCDWKGKTYICYNAGNLCGFYYLAEAEYDGTVDEFLAANFE